MRFQQVFSGKSVIVIDIQNFFTRPDGSFKVATAVLILATLSRLT
jgi:nicotinamidase-related amidase